MLHYEVSKNPTLEEFLAHALPKDAEGSHALVVGEHHNQVEHLRYFTAQLDKLKTQNNLGAIGLEKPPFMEVFLWAYADGIVDAGYIKRMFQAYSDSCFFVSMQAKTDLAIEAIKRDIPFFCFDARDTFADFSERKDSLSAYQEALFKDPSLREKLINERDIYYQDNPFLKDAPFPTNANTREIKKSTRYMSDERVQEALYNLRSNEPWVEFIAKGGDAKQDVERS